MKPSLLLGALVLLAQACADPDESLPPSELAAPASLDPAACKTPRGTWRVTYQVADPGSSCALLVRDALQDFDAPLVPGVAGSALFAAPPGAAHCESTLSGPDESCAFRDRQVCSSTLAGARYDSLVSRSFTLVAPDRLEGGGTVHGTSESLGVCQTSFTLVAAPE